MGAFTVPIYYSEVRKSQDVALRASRPEIYRVWEEFYKLTGRQYLPIEKYRTGKADHLLVMMGSYCETAMVAIDKLQDEGLNIGLIRIRLWRPFPFDELRTAVSSAKKLIVLDRALSLGGNLGPVCSEIKAALYEEANKPQIIGFTGGLGGRDISVETFESIIKQGIQESAESKDNEVRMIEVRE